MPSPSIVFVCWGNICRSPMAAEVARQEAAMAGIEAEISSAAVSREEIGAEIDPRAATTLAEHGYRVAPHSARQITAAEIAQADLVIAMEGRHLDRLRQIAGGQLDASRVRLLTDFDPAAEPGSGVDDPWYGDQSGFVDTLASLQAAMPGILDELPKLAR